MSGRALAGKTKPVSKAAAGVRTASSKIRSTVTTAKAMRATAPAGVQTRSKSRMSSGGVRGAGRAACRSRRPREAPSARAASSTSAEGGTEKILTVPTILTLLRVAAIPFVVFGKRPTSANALSERFGRVP